MKCEHVRELMLDAMSSGALTGEAEAHRAGCAECARLWSALQAVEAPLNEWAVPEVSPYFATRMQARLAEARAQETAKPAWLKLNWLHAPVLRLAATGLMAIAVAVGVDQLTQPKKFVAPPMANTNAPSAVRDLQDLDRNQDLYSDLDVLDDLTTDANKAPSAGSGEEI